MSPVLFVLLGISVATAPPQNGVKGQEPQFGTMRVAVVNIGYVFNNYERAQEFKKNLEGQLLPYKQKAKQLNDQIRTCEEALKKPDLPAETAEEFRDEIRDAKRQLEDMAREITKVIGKKQEEKLVTIWKDGQDGVKAVAAQHKIDIVFGYGDPLDKDLLDLFPNVNRKMQAMDAGSTVPLFLTQRADISEEVTRHLNRRSRELKKEQPKGPPIDFE
jgi:Skp family chaperone for outer membrane proteins